ncbi:response regulator transcription factor [Brachybacterium sp. Z12]|uniref:response regulator transcription factor n=1 Tax=Brachybacterium sp. Z12 TaxID=2759167 RepID=UPI0037C10C2E
MTAHSPEVLRVILVDDENLIRSALATMLSLEDDLEVRGEAATVADGARLAQAEQPDVAVLDLQLPDGDGLELAARIATLSPRPAASCSPPTPGPAISSERWPRVCWVSCRRPPPLTSWPARCARSPPGGG